MNKFDDLLVFAKVVELRSFTAAAETLQMSRSLTSKRVSLLEERLGVQLLQRTTRKLNLTEAGRTLYQYCEKLQDTLAEAELAVGDIRLIPHGKLMITAPVTFGQMYLSEIVSKFLQRYPDISLRLSLSDTQADLVGGGFDLAVRIGSLPDSSLRARKIGQTKVICLASPEYIQVHGAPKHPNDLQDHNCLTYKHMGDRENYWIFRDDQQDIRVKVNSNFNCDNGMPLVKAAATGLGVAYVPDFMLTSDLDKNLTRLLVDFCQIEHGIFAVYPDSRQESLNTRSFIDFFDEEYQSARITT